MVTYEQILSDLKNKIYKPVYLLTGEEIYYIDIITNYILTNVLTESEKAFNQTIFYGKDSNVLNIIEACKRYPMMSNNQVVIVKEAQDLKNFDDLIHYVERPLNTTLLVLDYKYKTFDKRKKIYKIIDDKGAIIESPKLYDSKIPSWINSFVKNKGYTITPNAAVMLNEFVGNDLSRIAGEIEKLILTLPKEEKNITPQHVEKNIGISKEYNNFELQKALGAKDILKCNRIIQYFGRNPKSNPMVLVLSSLYTYFTRILLYHGTQDKSDRNIASVLKVNPFFVKEYQIAAKNYTLSKTVRVVSYLREYDMKSKGLGNASTSDEELLRELIFKILH